jgi:DnaJ domain
MIRPSNSIFLLTSLGLELSQRGPNFYARLGVTRNSNPLEIKRAYKRMSLELHPDKNPSPDASDQFDRIKKAYDILMDLELREVYNKFGKEGIDSNKRYDETQFLLEAAIFYVTWGLMAFLLTLGKKSGDARNWTLTGLIVMMVLEVTIMTSHGNPLPVWLFPTWTEHEFIWLLHSLFPAYMNGCRSLGSYLYVDLDAQQRQLLMALQEQGKDILLVLRDVQISIQSMQYSSNSSPPAAGVVSNASSTSNSARVVGEDVPYGSSVPRVTPTGKFRELQERLHASHANVAQAVNNLKPSDSASSSNNMGFYLMILGYIVISYVFQ